MSWQRKGDLHDGRHVWYRPAVELIQRPSGEWTARHGGSPMRLELGTQDIATAKRRVNWSPEEWARWRAMQAEDRRALAHDLARGMLEDLE